MQGCSVQDGSFMFSMVLALAVNAGMAVQSSNRGLSSNSAVHIALGGGSEVAFMNMSRGNRSKALSARSKPASPLLAPAAIATAVQAEQSSPLSRSNASMEEASAATSSAASLAQEHSEASRTNLYLGTEPNKGCPCVSVDVGDQATPAGVNIELNGANVSYPLGTGSMCAAWDNGNYPGACIQALDNPGKDAGWCGQEWCYVDPCNCQISAKPKITAYLPRATYNNKPVYYSYATCGGGDFFNKCPGKPQAECTGKCTWLQQGSGSCVDTGSFNIQALCR